MEPILEICYEEQNLTMNNDRSRIVILEKSTKIKRKRDFLNFNLTLTHFQLNFNIKISKNQDIDQHIAGSTGVIWDNHENSA